MGDLQLILAGTGLDNDNRGVEALGRSVVDALAHDGRVDHLVILDNGWGVRQSTAGGSALPTELVGARKSRRWYRPESWAQIRASQALGGIGNAVARRFAAASALLDLSAGDSFTDLYGRARLDMVAAPKAAAVRAHTPIVFLPQTYGPFTTDYGRRTAEHLVRSAEIAYSRDAWSHEQLIDLAGTTADQTRLREGVDVAFALPQRRPLERVAMEIEDLSDEVLAGVNVSGLLYGRARQSRFGIAGDYVETLTCMVKTLIADGARVMFVPHVHGGWGESDLAAALDITRTLTAAERERTLVVPSDLRASELKWCVAQADWFIGSRMHATIAALSTCTPAFGYAYSDKTLGVFATCGMAAHVADARTVAGEEAVQRAMESFSLRDRSRSALADTVPAVAERARGQILEIVDHLSDISQGRYQPRPLG